jgi:pimeloyl-ACP methyl ester carboxylesterase
MATERPVSIPLGPGAAIAGDLTVPDVPAGLVLFAHGSGSSRHSPRNRAVAQFLNEAGFATLLIDLLIGHEDTQDDSPMHPKWDIEMLSERLARAEHWTRPHPVLGRLPVGYFGASTGAAAALVAAARHPSRVKAVVSRGGRPDLAGDELGQVAAPTLLIVGGRDVQVLGLNRQAAHMMHAEVRLEVVPGATHLFPEAGAMAQVARLAADWFRVHLRAPVQEARSLQ